MKKVIICTDLEGVSLVDSIDMMSGDRYPFACRRLEADLNAAVAGCFDGGAEEVWYLDGHHRGTNINPENIDPRAHKITNFNAPDLFDGCIAYMEVGLHAKAGTLNAFLDHTQASDSIHDYYINGRTQGEFAQGAAYCGAYGVPFVMVSGDRAACAEAADLVPGIVCAVVKEARGRNNAVCIDGEAALRLIREAACEGVRRANEIRPCTLTYPAEIRFHFNYTWFCDQMAAALPHWTRINGRTMARQIDKIVTYRDVNLS